MSILRIRKNGEPCVFEHHIDYTKGFCDACNKMKLFRIDEAETAVRHIFSRVSLPLPVRGSPDFFGTCTNGHSQWFHPWEWSEPQVWKRDATQLVFRPFTADERGPWAKMYYDEWKNFSFRKPEVEEHFTSDHECDKDCPEYQYGWEDTWY